MTVSNQNNPMYVAELWRYPVKSLAGEQIDVAEIHADGIAGDRRVLVYNEQTRRVITSRTHPKLLGLKATLGGNGEALINGSDTVATLHGSTGLAVNPSGIRRYGPMRFRQTRQSKG